MPPQQQAWTGPERRDIAGRQRLRRRFHVEYQEFPGLSLTAVQAARLFSIPADVCGRIFEELVQAGVLRRKWKGQYSTAQTPWPYPDS
jgi:hypothetical protein